MSTFANRLKTAMENSNMKAVDLHNKTGISKSTISEYLAGSYEPKQKNIYKLATALNILPSELMGISPNPSPTPDTAYYNDPEVAAIANEMKENPGMRVLLDASRGLKKESLEEVRKFIEFQKAKELGDYDG